jgi:hypothetical protein
VIQAIADSKPGSTALDIGQALAFAARTQQLGAVAGKRPGEIVYAGPGRLAETDQPIPAVPNLRVLPVSDAISNNGIRHVGLRRSPDDSSVWDVYVSCRNYGLQPSAATVAIGFGGAPAGAQRVTLAPNADHEVAFKLRTHAAGLLEVRLFPTDDFPDDNRAVLEIPAYAGLAITIYTDSPDALRPFFGAASRVSAVFKPTAQYQAAGAGLIVLDRFHPKEMPRGDSLWIDPPADHSPIAVRTRVDHPGPIEWSSEQVIAAGLRTKDARPDTATVFEPATTDLQIARVEQGPVVIARTTENHQHMVVVGFHPSDAGLRYELATPLLIGNILRWLAPESFRNLDLSASSAGTVNAELAEDVAPENIRVLGQDGQPLPFSLTGRSLHFFSGKPGIVRVLAGSHESVYSLSLPGMWNRKWEPPANVHRGLPAYREALGNARDLWQLLAVLGAAVFILEWALFGRTSRMIRRPATAPWRRLKKAS